jgi:hypothetical protein
MKTVLILFAGVMISLGAFAGEQEQDFEQYTSAAVYYVPVPQDLVRYSVFDVGGATVTETKDTVTIKYSVPEELTGAVNPIEISGKRVQDGPVMLKGGLAVMECSADEDYSNCAVTYTGLRFEPEARTQLLKARAHSEEELNQRMQIAQRFQMSVQGQQDTTFRMLRFEGAEPHGFLKILKRE